MEEKQEMLHHRIEVNEYFTIDFKMPKKISILEFKGLMLQAEKFFKIGQMELFNIELPAIQELPKRKYKARRAGTKNFGLTEQQKNIVKDNYGHLTRQEIADKIGCTKYQVQYVIKLLGLSKSEGVKKAKSNFGGKTKKTTKKSKRGLSDNEKWFVIKNRKKMKPKEMASALGVERKKVVHYLGNWRNGISPDPNGKFKK